MPIVPTERNSAPLASATDAKLVTPDLSGTGLQALDHGLQAVAEAGGKIAGMVEQRAQAREQEQAQAQTLHDDAAAKLVWNRYAGVAREATTHFGQLEGFAALAALEPTRKALTDAYEQGRAALTTDRQREIYDQSVGSRLAIDMGRLQLQADRQNAIEQDRQSAGVQANSADDAVAHADDPDLFDKYVATGAEALASQAALRGEDPAVTQAAIGAYRSGIHRRVADGLVMRDPVAAAHYLLAHRDEMTAPDQAMIERGLFEPLARAQAAADVDGLAPPRPTDGSAAPTSPEERAAWREAIEAGPWNETRKAYARNDLAERFLAEDRRRTRAETAAKETALAETDRLGPDFTSITQLPAATRRDLDAATTDALMRRAANNLDPRPVPPHGAAALKLNLMATYQPAEFARQDLRLAKDLVAPAEYDALVRRQRGIAGYPPGAETVTQQRIGDVVGATGPRPEPISYNGTDREAVQPIATQQDSSHFASDGNGTVRGAVQSPPRRRASRPRTATWLNYLNEAEDADAIVALNKMQSPHGAMIIYSHGSVPDGTVTDKAHGADGQYLRPKAIYWDLKRLQYRDGTPVIVSSCFAANGTQARELSRLTKGVVYAAKAYVTEPSDANGKYELSVNTDRFGRGDVSGYARFENGRETPSSLLAIRYDPDTGKWTWFWRKTPAPVGDRVTLPTRRR